ncbi:hypothetical protein N7541_005139 [Penicillium brevicompactum]|uniref:C2H2-type domain-containing protein n=1 Tax=Penicillium brevicompactum TaxID=5074 RepID=A0A9W9RDD4_PENBR|nr:hypothetical protein N7541_005139 [Penicillium brevicompactum]
MADRSRTRRQRLCSWCFKSFTKDEHLARHVRTHTREKPTSPTGYLPVINLALNEFLAILFCGIQDPIDHLALFTLLVRPTT